MSHSILFVRHVRIQALTVAMHNEPRFSQKKVKKYIARFLQLNPNQLSWNFSHWQSKWHLTTFCVRQVDIFHTFGFRGNSNLAAEKSIFSNRFALFALKVPKVKTVRKFNWEETANDLLDLFLCVDKIS